GHKFKLRFLRRRAERPGVLLTVACNRPSTARSRRFVGVHLLPETLQNALPRRHLTTDVERRCLSPSVNIHACHLCQLTARHFSSHQSLTVSKYQTPGRLALPQLYCVPIDRNVVRHVTVQIRALCFPCRCRTLNQPF